MKSSRRLRASRSIDRHDRRAGQRGRRKSRAAFLEPFDPLLEQIETARGENLYPFYACVEPVSESEEPPVVLVANDYLGLAMHERVRDAASSIIAQYGTSRCASPLAGGQTQLHRTLEGKLAAFLRQESVALFASGYQANVGIIAALMRRDDLILSDLFNHASIVDGARLSGAEVRYFQHNSPTHLETILKQDAVGRRVLVVVEGIYSADGDIVCLPEVCEIAHAHGALVMIDEAHSLGVLGEGGRGATEHWGLLEAVDVIMGTMSKSLASAGGFVAGDRRLVDAVAHSARSLIFSAALPPANVSASLTALEILQSEPERRERLWRNARFLLEGLKARGFDTMQSETAVIPILVGEPSRTMEFTARLRAHGVYVCPAIPPMVQSHLSRIRMHVTAGHNEATLSRALTVIDDVARSVGIPRSERGVQSATQPTQPATLRRVR